MWWKSNVKTQKMLQYWNSIHLKHMLLKAAWCETYTYGLNISCLIFALYNKTNIYFILVVFYFYAFYFFIFIFILLFLFLDYYFFFFCVFRTTSYMIIYFFSLHDFHRNCTELNKIKLIRIAYFRKNRICLKCHSN